MLPRSWEIIWIMELMAALLLSFATTPAIILLNNHIMTTANFPYPVVVANMGVTGTLIFSQAMVRCGAWSWFLGISDRCGTVAVGS